MKTQNKSKNRELKVIVKTPITKEQANKMFERMIEELKIVLSN